MPPKRLNARRGKITHRSSESSPPPAEQPDQRDQPDPHPTGRTRSRSRSRESRSPTPPSLEGSVASVASISSRQPNDQAKKRAKKIVFSLTAEQEESMLEFFQANALIWDCKLNGYRRTDLKTKLWEDQGARMEPPISSLHLQGWFKSLRDTHTRLHKKKSGDGAPGELTEREIWIRDHFDFLKSVIRHRPEPCKTVKATLQEHKGNLCAAEAACVDLGSALDDDDMPTVTKGKGKSNRLHENNEDALLTSLQMRVQQSEELLAGLQPVPQQPVTTKTAFPNCVRDSLLSMDKPKFKKARLSINRILSELMAEDSDDDTLSVGPSMPLPNMAFSLPQVRPMYVTGPSSSRASKSPSVSPSEQYQPAPHMWKPHPPQASVWAPQSQEYMDSYCNQQQHHQPVTSLEHQSMPPRPPLPFNQHQNTATSVAGAIASASQTLIPTLGVDTILNLSNISNISGLSDLSDMTATNTEMNTPPQKNSDREKVYN